MINRRQSLGLTAGLAATPVLSSFAAASFIFYLNQ